MTAGLGWEVIQTSYPGFRPLSHVVPIADLRQHSTDIATQGDDFCPHCWCRPELDDEVVVHNSADGREAHEAGRAMS